jgi:small subunit ribosomal protein S15
MKKEKGEAEAVIVPETEPAESSKKTVKKTKKKAEKPEFKTDLNPREIEEMIVAFANSGHSASEIGMLLRDQHNVPKTKIVTGKTINQVLQEKQLQPEIPEDLMALIRRVVALDSHLQKNRKDFSAKRGYQLTVSKIRRLVAYYQGTNRLPKKWRYSIETARLLVK